MLKLILAIVIVLLLGQTGFFWLAYRQTQRADAAFNAAALSRHWQARAIRWEAETDTLYRELRVYITGADSLATRLRWAEGRYSQCMAQF